MEPDQLPDRTASQNPRQRLEVMDHYVENKYSKPDTRKIISQREARDDAFSYVLAEFRYLETIPYNEMDDDEQKLTLSSIDAIHRAMEDTEHDDWSKMKAYFKEVAALSKASTGEDENPRAQAFLNIAGLI